ncbi:GNAT family N-acetyltransferase [Gracilibacillus alcaliphilus]|uniref:GNAT family N-acetyltransferase n=1 Tax=Gracilibacillus alcaliphilus TaxID=1401441 RepID=UPI00195D7AC7|nr:GNAT family N-acetyltransferase [Gracilibacillus alcaliphilus]MBM7678476.1 RimJ/RimL family protein N-acetyltransferase [Gracilibacillus alcaliphilus]
MLKKRDMQEASQLFELMSHPEVFPYVRNKANNSDEFYFLTKQTIEAEERGELISRTIMDEYFNPIGTINLFDITNKSGFLATWIGRPYFGKGYNKVAKDAFLQELFYQLDIETVFIKIRHSNLRSLSAIWKLPYVTAGNKAYPVVLEQINTALPEPLYDLYVIERQHYLNYFENRNEGEEAI